MMHHPVAERGGGDQAGFAFVEGEEAIRAGLVAAVRQFPVQGQQFALQVQFEGDRAGDLGRQIGGWLRSRTEGGS